jgi:hypothetical protein
MALVLVGCGASTTEPVDGAVEDSRIDADDAWIDSFVPYECRCCDGRWVSVGEPDECVDACGTCDASVPDTSLCSGPMAVPPADPVVAPLLTQWRVTAEDLPDRGDGMTNPFPLTIDPAACDEGKWFIYLPFGSAWAQVHETSDGACEVWLGGETEDPRYDGTPTRYCRFPAMCEPVTVVAGDGGPAEIESPYCVP